jgi:hypothetical protein
MGKCGYFQWPKKWHSSDILRDMTFLEMLPIALAICLWHKEFHIPHNDCNCFKVTFLEKAMRLICFNNSWTLLSGICMHISIVSKVRPKYSILYMATAKASKPYHYIRVSRKMFDDLMVWKLFLENFNGVSYILDKDWVSNVDLTTIVTVLK